MVTSTALSQTAVTPPVDGLVESSYRISELGHLVWLSETTANSTGKYYTMTTDIDADYANVFGNTLEEEEDDTRTIEKTLTTGPAAIWDKF